MTPSCPNCGAPLDIQVALAMNSVATVAAGDATTRQRPEQLDFSEVHLQRLKEIMCGPINDLHLWKPKQATMRPVVSDKNVVGILKDNRERETLDRVASKMQATIRWVKGLSADALLELRQCSRVERDLPGRMENVFEAVGAIIYAMEWTSGQLGVKEYTPNAADSQLVPPVHIYHLSYQSELKYMFELMLHIDYGFPAYPLRGPVVSAFRLQYWFEFEVFSKFLVALAWRWRQGQALPTREAWDQIVRVTGGWTHLPVEMPVWDVATMSYYYHSHHTPVAVEEHKQGWTGYTGVLQEMVAEVPTRGKDRLERKLSLDAHLLIPRFVRDRNIRRQMMLIAQDLAARHSCQLAPPTIPKPPVWRRWGGADLPRQRLEDREQVDEKEKLIEGLGLDCPGKDSGSGQWSPKGGGSIEK